MKGTICKGESLRLSFDESEVYFSGKYVTGVRVQDGRFSKRELIKLREAGVIDSWTEYSWGFDLSLSSDLIEWED